jgi:uncharacterized protein DUF6545
MASARKVLAPESARFGVDRQAGWPMTVEVVNVFGLGAFAAAACTAVALVMSVVRHSGVRVSARAAAWTATAGLMALGFAAAMNTPVVEGLAGRVGEPAVVFGAAVLEALGAYGLVVSLIYASVTGQQRRRLVVVQSVLAAGCLVALALFPTGTPNAAVSGRAAPARALSGLDLTTAVQAGYIAVALGMIILLAGRIARRPETDRLTGRGLVLAQLGAVSGLCCAALAVAAPARPLDEVTWTDDVGRLLLSVSVLGLAAGFTLAAWFPSVGKPMVWVRAIHASSRLRPLHAMLADHVPPIRGEVGADAVIGRWRHPVAALVHLVIRIRDAQQAVHSHRHPDAGRWARELAAAQQLDAHTTELLVEAAELATAIPAVDTVHTVDGHPQPASHNRGEGEPEVSPVAGDRRRWARRASDAPPSPHAVPDVLAESRRLRMILLALRHSPTVDAVRRRAANSTADRISHGAEDTGAELAADSSGIERTDGAPASREGGSPFPGGAVTLSVT